MLALFALAVVVGAAPQSASPAPPPVDDVVRVAAFVTDRRHRPIDNLTAADFELWEDGAPRPIDTVRFVSASSTPRFIGIYLDEYHLTPGSADRVRGDLLRFIDGLQPRDQLAVLKPLDSLLGIELDADRERARGIIARFTGRKGDYAPVEPYEREYMGNAPAAIVPARAQITASALNALAVRLGQASADARKTLVVVTEGLSGPLERRPRFSLPTFESIAQAANRSNVSIYSIDPHEPTGADDKESALGAIVAATDGRGFRGPGEIAPGLERIAAESSGYYLVSYRSAGKTDNAYHAIDLRAKRPDVSVRTRAGYWSASPDDLMRAEVLAASRAPRIVKPPEPPLRISRLIRPWFGVSRGTGGRSRVTFVWEPAPPTPGERVRTVPARLQFTALTPDRGEIFEGTVLPAGSGVLADGDASSRAVFEAPPGRVRVQMSIEDAAEQEIDFDVRDIAVIDLAAPVAIGTPEVLRVRTEREFRALEADPGAVPAPSRVFSRIERLLIRVPAYAPDGPPSVSAVLLSKMGQPMRRLDVTPPSVPGGPSQIDLPLASLASAEYQIEFQVKSAAGEAKDSISFRVTP